MNFDKLEMERIILRTIMESDLDDFLSYRSDENIAKYQYWQPFSREEAEKYIENNKHSRPGIPGEWFQLGIVDKNTGCLIGDCALKQDLFEPRVAEVGCNLSNDYQKKGIAKEALVGLFNYAFGNLNVHRIHAITDCENIACVRLLEALRMRREGHFVQNVWFKGGWGSEYCYAVLKDEWLGKLVIKDQIRGGSIL